MKKNIIVCVVALSTITCAWAKEIVKEPVDWVNGKIGTISHMLVPTFPATQLPNGMLRFIPPNYSFVTDRVGPFNLCIPQHRTRFPVLTMAPVNNWNGEFKKWSATWDQQKSLPYRYSVWLDSENITVDLAPAQRSAIVEFGFESNGKHAITFAPFNKNGKLNVKDSRVIGMDKFYDLSVYIAAEFNPQPLAVKEENGKVAVIFGDKPEKVKMRYAISYQSQNQADLNLRNEMTDWDIERVAKQGREIWNKTLGQIELEGGTDNDKAVFYTALWRTYERMVNFTEDGKYIGYDRQIHNTDGIDYYADDWTWDTFRAMHPLMVMLRPKAQADKLASYLRMMEQNKEKWMPLFPNISHDEHKMNGFHTPSLFLDAWRKGIRSFDIRTVLDACVRTERETSKFPWYRGKKTRIDRFYDEHGYFPALPEDAEETEYPDDHNCRWEKRQTVAVTLAFSYDCWTIAELAREVKALEKDEARIAQLDEIIAEFTKKSFNYRNLWKADTGFFHPKNEKGEWIMPFDYSFSGGQAARYYYDENNAWTYIWDVSHNIPDLINLFGGADKMDAKMDEMFNTGYGRTRWAFYNRLPDSTGNMGMFTMGNEPSFHIPYLYNYVGKPWKTQKLVRKIMEAWFRNDLMGICGDEDGGGMSAFAVWSAIGFYPVTPGKKEYTWGSPIFKKVTIHLENGKDLVINAHGVSEDAKYIKSITVNGKPLNGVFMNSDDILNGGVIDVEMSERPAK